MHPDASKASVSPAPAGPHAQAEAEVPATAIINIKAFQWVRMGAINSRPNTANTRETPGKTMPAIK